MTPTRSLVSGILAVALGASSVYAADLSSYRGFQFGAQLPAVAKQAGMKPTDARMVHQRPAAIQELSFQPNLFRSSASSVDPVADVLLSFYNGELFRIAVLYDRYKVAGMTPEDMIAALSTTYGIAAKPTADVAYHSYYSDVAAVIARWEDSGYSYNLIRAEDRSSFAMVMYSKTLDALAQPAILEAVRLDTAEAPQREADLARKQAEDNRVEQEKSRLANKAGFRP